MDEKNIKEMDVFLAEKVKDSGHFFCKHFTMIGDKSAGDCGKVCYAYQPRNGKSGACKHLGFVYEQSDKIKRLFNPKLQKINVV